jgi:hypothetical protein
MTVRPDHNQLYGTKHRALRARWAKKVKAGLVKCAKCGYWIPPNAEWDLGHDPYDRSQYIGPLHQRCNRDTRLERSLRRPAATRATWW